MNEGLKILSERVKTNPEEFLNRDEKWWEAMRYLEEEAFPWTDEEREVIKKVHEDINEARTKAIRDKFTSVVMNTLMGEVPLAPEPAPKQKKMKISSTQLNLANKLGLTAPQYATELLKMKEEERLRKLEKAIRQYEESGDE